MAIEADRIQDLKAAQLSSVNMINPVRISIWICSYTHHMDGDTWSHS